MRQFLITIFCVAAVASMRAEDHRSPLDKFSGKYDELNGEFSLTFTGTDTLRYEGYGQKINGHYMVHPDDGMILISLEKNRPPAASNLMMLNPVREGMLYTGRETMLAVPGAKEKAQALLPDLDRLAQAEGVVAACLFYASSHDGKLPSKLTDLFPDLWAGTIVWPGSPPRQPLRITIISGPA